MTTARRSLALAIPMSFVAGCSLILDFDTPITDAGPPAADAGIDAIPRPDGGVDMYEAGNGNNDFMTATPINPGTYDALSIYPKADRDYYTFTLAASQTVQIDCNFVPADGDLELVLYDSAVPANIVGSSMNFSIDEHITAGPLPAGTYFIEVYGFADDFTNSYQLVLTLM